MKKIGISLLLILITIVVISPTFAGINARGMSLSDKAIDSNINIEAEAIEEKTVPLEKLSEFKLESSKSSYSKTKSILDFVDEPFGMWSVHADSLAKDESGSPYEIDSIYVKGSLYIEESNGDITYKGGKSIREYDSAEAKMSYLSGIDLNVSFATSYHEYKHSGYETIIHRQTDDTARIN